MYRNLTANIILNGKIQLKIKTNTKMSAFTIFIPHFTRGSSQRD